eukprot:TRINITY_DN3693_c0_g1_i1.p1 TRINITY_DN3693_c0_g1~~TRINITY_DN3693_c0_g1_i1.p1  ORF type:complete len:870 (+),score=213.72 TRINITY_DN3693_c0_g1_i1:64-2673(+)
MKIVQQLLIGVVLAILCPALAIELKNWRLETSEKVSQSGGVISSPSYDDSKWYPVTVPSTVMGGLVENGVYPDIFYSKNLQKVNSTQFDVPWWYRTTFRATPGKTCWVLFKGINYKANVFFNGRKLSDIQQTIGTFRYFSFDLTQYLVESENVLALEVFRPSDLPFPSTNYTAIDLAITFVDWAPYPPDQNMGLWKSVELHETGPVSLQYPMVATKLSGPEHAHLTVLIEVTNRASLPSVSGILRGSIASINCTFQKEVRLNQGQSLQVIFDNATVSCLNVKHPQLWWPWQMGDAKLHHLNLSFVINGQVSDVHETRFGIREMSSELTSMGYRLYRVNGKPILIRGGGYSPDLFQRTDAKRMRQEMIYVRHMNLNAIRLEGKMENDDFFNIADEMGLLVMPGWCCCDAWQHWDIWTQDQFEISRKSLQSQIARLRIHASVLVFLYSSDELPPIQVEKNYLTVFPEEHWPNPILAAASQATSPLTGMTGVKMTGPYSWVPPIYWLQDNDTYGGAYGFLTEGGPGENPMTFESMKRTVPQGKLWPINDEWNYHCGNELGEFGSLKWFIPPLNARYGAAKSAEDFTQKSQLAAYEGLRAMYEAYSRNKYTSTGVIQWMQNNAWPENIWHLYDWYLNPSASYFATRSACEALHIQYSYTDASIWVVNSMYESQSGTFHAEAEIMTLDGKVLHRTVKHFWEFDSDSATHVFTLPKIDLPMTYFLHLVLYREDAHDSETLSENMYWLSTKADVLNWDDTNFFRTACSQWADMTALQNLPHVDLTSQGNWKESQIEGMERYNVEIHNPSPFVAFFIRVRLIDTATGQDILPILWNRNYISLLTNTSATLTADFELDIPRSRVQHIVELFNNISGKQ